MKNVIRCAIGGTLLSIIVSSCASVPKESIELSAQLDRQLRALESANASLIAQVYAEKEARVEEYLDSIWYPSYLTALFNKEATQRLWEAAINSDNPEDRAIIMSVITKEAIDRYKNERNFVIQPITLEKDSVTSAFAGEFAKARLMNDAAGRLLESHYKVQSAYNSMLPAGQAEKLDSLVQRSIGRIDSRLQTLKSGANILKDAGTALRDSVFNKYPSNN